MGTPPPLPPPPLLHCARVLSSPPDLSSCDAVLAGRPVVANMKPRLAWAALVGLVLAAAAHAELVLPIKFVPVQANDSTLFPLYANTSLFGERCLLPLEYQAAGLGWS